MFVMPDFYKIVRDAVEPDASFKAKIVKGINIYEERSNDVRSLPELPEDYGPLRCSFDGKNYAFTRENANGLNGPFWKDLLGQSEEGIVIMEQEEMLLVGLKKNEELHYIHSLLVGQVSKSVSESAANSHR